MAAFDMDEPQAVVSPGGVGFDINCGVRLVRWEGWICQDWQWDTSLLMVPMTSCACKTDGPHGFMCM